MIVIFLFCALRTNMIFIVTFGVVTFAIFIFAWSFFALAQGRTAEAKKMQVVS